MLSFIQKSICWEQVFQALSEYDNIPALESLQISKGNSQAK